MNPKRILSLIALFILLNLACGLPGLSPDDGTSGSGQVDRPDNAIEIEIVYAPESDLYLPQAIADFNRSFANGVNPVTGERLADGEQPIYVVGRPGSSGTVHEGIINAFIAPNNANVEQPTIFSPSVSHWLALVNYQTGRNVFDLADSPATARAPVVMAIWESRLRAIEAVHGSPVGWEELLQVFEQGWGAYGISGREAVFYGHTDPFISSTALSTLIAEFYASARYLNNNTDIRRLSLDQVRDEDVRQGVRDIESLIKHYSSRTTEFKEYIAQGPNYLDFVALEENDLIFINQGKTDYQPPERLVALYPKEGTFWHEHPFAIPNAPWVSDEQRAAARVFTDYVLGESVQRMVLENGFRPVNPDVPLDSPGSPFVDPNNGVDINQPSTVLQVPDPEVIAAVQESWEFVKKPADIMIVIDVSGSMEGDKLDQAKEAALRFLDEMPAQNQVGLMSFSDVINVHVPPSSFEGIENDLRSQITNLEAAGDTALFDATLEAVRYMRPAADEVDRIKAIVILSDGEDTASDIVLGDVVSEIELLQGGRNTVLVVPVAYGSGADIRALNSIARASATKVQSGNPEDIQQLLELISSYF